MGKIEYVEKFIHEFTGEKYKIVCWSDMGKRVEVITEKPGLHRKSFTRPVFEYQGEKYIMYTEHERLKYILEKVDKGE